MTEQNTITVLDFNDWIVEVAEEAGMWVQKTDTNFEFFVNDRVRLSSPSLVDLIKQIDSSGFLGAGLVEELSETFDF
jgi:hypothetical protein